MISAIRPVAKQLRERWLATPHKNPDQPVFATPTGRGLDYRLVGHQFRQTVTRAGISANGRLSIHSLRHGYASLLISNGLNVVFVSRQLGHAKPNITLQVYAHLFAQADHADTARTALEASHATTLPPGH